MQPPTSRIAFGAAFAKTPVGLSWESSAAAVRAGITRLAEHPYMLDREGQPFVVACVPTVSGVTRLSRCIELLDTLLIDAVPVIEKFRGTVATWVCLPEGWGEHRATFIPRVLAATGSGDMRIHVLPRGHASGLIALQQATTQISGAQIDGALILGVDSHIDPDVLEQADDERQLLSEANKFGFPPGEGAGGVFLAADTSLKSGGLPVLGRVVDVGLGVEPEPMGSEGVSTGVGLSAAINGATVRHSSQTPVGRIYSDQNGQRYRDSDYVWATQRIRPVFENLSDFVTPAEAWGDVGAATAPLLLGLPLAAASRRYSTCSTSLVFCCSTGADRAAVTLHHAR